MDTKIKIYYMDMPFAVEVGWLHVYHGNGIAEWVSNHFNEVYNLVATYPTAFPDGTFTAENIAAMLEGLFNLYQNLEHVRSMSVGDVVVVAESAFVVDSVGFTPVSLPATPRPLPVTIQAQIDQRDGTLGLGRLFG